MMTERPVLFSRDEKLTLNCIVPASGEGQGEGKARSTTRRRNVFANTLNCIAPVYSDLTAFTIAAASIPYFASNSSGLPECGNSRTASL